MAVNFVGCRCSGAPQAGGMASRTGQATQVLQAARAGVAMITTTVGDIHEGMGGVAYLSHKSPQDCVLAGEAWIFYVQVPGCHCEYEYNISKRTILCNIKAIPCVPVENEAPTPPGHTELAP